MPLAAPSNITISNIKWEKQRAWKNGSGDFVTAGLQWTNTEAANHWVEVKVTTRAFGEEIITLNRGATKCEVRLCRLFLDYQNVNNRSNFTIYLATKVDAFVRNADGSISLQRMIEDDILITVRLKSATDVSAWVNAGYLYNAHVHNLGLSSEWTYVGGLLTPPMPSGLYAKKGIIRFTGLSNPSIKIPDIAYLGTGVRLPNMASARGLFFKATIEYFLPDMDSRQLSQFREFEFEYVNPAASTPLPLWLSNSFSVKVKLGDVIG